MSYYTTNNAPYPPFPSDPPAPAGVFVQDVEVFFLSKVNNDEDQLTCEDAVRIASQAFGEGKVGTKIERTDPGVFLMSLREDVWAEAVAQGGLDRETEDWDVHIDLTS